jgi:hypothetical protein
MLARRIMVVTGLCLAGCGSQTGAMNHKDDMNTSSVAIDVSVTGDASPALVVRCVAKNVSSQPVHVFDSSRMPYLLDDNGTLVVLHGVSPPPDDRELNLIEIPTTRTLAAGDSFAFTAALVPLRLRGHYGDSPPAPARHGAATVVCRVGFGATPIDAGARAHTTITALLAWQALASSRPVVVQLP